MLIDWPSFPPKNGGYPIKFNTFKNSFEGILLEKVGFAIIPHLIYFIEGRLEYEGEFLFGKKYNGKGYDNNGNIIYIIYELINGTGKVKEYNYDEELNLKEKIQMESEMENLKNMILQVFCILN